MQKTEKNPDQHAATLKLELERSELALQQLALENEKHRTFLQSWEVDVRPHQELLLRSVDMGHAYAKMTIQTIFWLNGGALIAFPAFAKLAGAEFSAHLTRALTSIGCFVLGLVLITVTALLAYFTCVTESTMTAAHREHAKLLHHLGRDSEEKNGKWKEGMAAATKIANTHQRRAFRLQWAAIASGMLSLLAFVAGACVAGTVLVG